MVSNMMEVISQISFLIFSGAFFLGFLITVFSGSARPIKIVLAVFSLIFLILIVAGFIFSRGFLIFLVTQIIVLIIIFYFVIIAGAAAGGGVYALMHKTHAYKKLSETELEDYLELNEFCKQESLDEERALSRIKNGFYQGGCFNNNWYIHKSELTQPSS